MSDDGVEVVGNKQDKRCEEEWEGSRANVSNNGAMRQCNGASGSFVLRTLGRAPGSRLQTRSDDMASLVATGLPRQGTPCPVLLHDTRQIDS